MRIAYTPAARTDLRLIRDYLHDHAPEAAASVSAAIRRRIAQLEKHPYLGKAGPLPGTRTLTINRFPYMVYYRVADEIISILHIRHQRRAPWRGES